MKRYTKAIFNIALIIAGIVFFYVTFGVLVQPIVEGESYFWPALGIWLLAAYVAIPIAHRQLTKLYLPNYYIGRTRTGDGIYGDPINIAINSSHNQLKTAMHEAGWVEAEKLSLRSTWRMIVSTVRRKSYPNAPVSSLYLFSRKQDLAFQKEVNGNPHSRHHVRFWKTPKNWWLPGGYQTDWLGAATFDKSVGISMYNGQFTHKISEHTDEERDFLIETLRDADAVQKVHIVKHFTTAFRSRNGGGDQIVTDGSMPFIDLK